MNNKPLNRIALRKYIAEHYDGGFWFEISSWRANPTPWEIVFFHERVTFEGADYNVTIIQKWYLEDDFEAVQQAIDIWFEVEKN